MKITASAPGTDIKTEVSGAKVCAIENTLDVVNYLADREDLENGKVFELSIVGFQGSHKNCQDRIHKYPIQMEAWIREGKLTITVHKNDTDSETHIIELDKHTRDEKIDVDYFLSTHEK